MSKSNNNINPQTPIWQLSVAEFIELQKNIIHDCNFPKKGKFEYGLKGLAKILGCCRTKAFELKKQGVFKEAIYQNGKTIIVDREKVLEILKKNISEKE